jgi:hypothetical protein
MTCAEFAERLEDYLSSALVSAERIAVEAHAAVCPACGKLLRDLQEATALVWLALPQVEPPARLRERVLTAARAAPRPPLLTAPPVVRPIPRPRWSLTLSQLAAAVSALALLVALGLGGWMVSLQGELSQQAAENARLRELVARQSDRLDRQRDAIYVIMSPTRVERSLAGSDAAPNARGRVYLDPNRQQGMVICSELPKPEPDRAYQVWLRNKYGVVSAGLLRMDDRGTGYAILEATQPIDQYEGIGISLEPASGSPQPTGPRMMSGYLH